MVVSSPSAWELSAMFIFVTGQEEAVVLSKGEREVPASHGSGLLCNLRQGA